MKKVIACLCAGLLMFSGAAFAADSGSSDDVEALRERLHEQNQVIRDLMQRLDALEAKQDEQAAQYESDKETRKPHWTEKVNLGGDLRYRHEYIDQEDKDDRHRHRIRARLDVDAELHPSLDLHFQLATGTALEDGEGGDPVSNNQTLTGAFSSKHIWLSQAYFDWHPGNVEGFSVLGGKIERPFITPGKSELIWDSDLNPEGGVVQLHRNFDPVELMANGYGFWITERGSDDPDDLYMLGAQGAVKYNFMAFDEKAHVMGGVSYYDYSDLKGEEGLVDDDFFRNSTMGVPEVFAEDFELVEGFGEVAFKVREVPVAVFGDYVNNTAADSDEDTGWSIGFSVGKAKDPNTWDFRYLYKEVEQDAVLGAFTDSDFGGGGTDSKGHELNLGYMLTKSVKLAASLFVNDLNIAKGESEKNYKKVQLDLEYKF